MNVSRVLSTAAKLAPDAIAASKISQRGLAIAATQQAAQQNQQSTANILGSMSASAGGSGVASLAQALANQQTQAAQAASASIGQQEQRNQMLTAQGEQQRQQLIASGEARSQELEMQKTGNLLQMAAGRKQAADEARQQALNTAIGGVMGAGQILGAGAIPTGE